MQYLISVRQALGISQVDMAHLLGVTRAQLSLAELGKRRLPAAALQFAVELQNRLLDIPEQEPMPEKMPRIPKDLADELDLLDIWCRQKGLYYKELANMLLTKQKQATRCLAILPEVFKTSKEAGADDESKRLALKIILDTSRRQIKNHPLELVERCADIGDRLVSLSRTPGGQPKKNIQTLDI